MKVFLITLLKIGLKILYAPMKLFKTKNRIVYLSRQSNDKSIDMKMLEAAVKEECPDTQQVFRLKMIDSGFAAKVSYCFAVIGDMYYLATSRVAIVDTYSITVSCLNHKSDLRVIQMWHALGAIKKFGLQAVGTKEGRDAAVSKAMCMHRNYDYVLAPSSETAKFYMEAFGVDSDKIKLCPLPRVDFITDGETRASDFYYSNPAAGQKKVVLYLPTFREREAYIINMLKTEFDEKDGYQLIISPHPLSSTEVEDKYKPHGDFNSEELIKLADIVITDYSAVAFEAALLMKPLYFFTPDYNEYMTERGINIDLKAEMPNAVFEDAAALVTALDSGDYDMNSLFSFKEKYTTNSKNNTQTLAKFISMLINSKA
ncbi:MAG: CDP-glycerol glycerophosphotransferase family protein [Ruminococcaceae bacterium]|nr:CDP-glycerol glycerophosphotransferase family protein [Oscillospiraceae bacterium]